LASPFAELAALDALKHGKALLKFISANDVTREQSHQAGFYLPKACWEVFTPHGPVKGRNDHHDVEITWQGDFKTNSKIHWYGNGTRAEYRLTAFGRDFPFLNPDSVGSLLVIVPVTLAQFNAYILDLDDDIDDIQAALNVQIIGSWGLFQGETGVVPEDEDTCIDKRFRAFAEALDSFPAGSAFSRTAHETLIACRTKFKNDPADSRLIDVVKAEFDLFKMVERKLCEPEIIRLFKSVEDFLTTAQTILQRRKSRAGRALENHVHQLLTDAAIQHELQKDLDGTKPDIVIPSAAAYNDRSYPRERLFIVGVKTTCKDRWRQVTKEGPAVERKHILTLQEGISEPQLKQIKEANVTLVVPAALHKTYPSADALLSVQGFVDVVRATLAN
jgi:hypothetical protein